jgi:hypothetical protein
MFVTEDKLGIQITLSESSTWLYWCRQHRHPQVSTSSLEVLSWCSSGFPREVPCLRHGRYKHVRLVVAMVLVLYVVPTSLLSLGGVSSWLVCFMYCSIMVVSVVTISNFIVM